MPWTGVLVTCAVLAVPLPGHAQAEPADRPALKQAGLEAYRARQYAQAVVRLQAYLANQPDDALAQAVLAYSLTELGQWDAAIAAHDRATELAPQDSQRWNGLCWTLILADRATQARPHCARALALDEHHWAARVNLGHTWLLAGDAAAAQAIYRDVLWRVGSAPELHEGPLADFDLFIGKGWQAAASQTAKAWFLAEWPRWQRVRQLSQEDVRLSKAGRLREALVPSTLAAQLSEQILGADHPQTGVSLDNLAQAYRSLGDLARALPLAERALAIAEQSGGRDHPSTGTRLNNLAGVLGDLGQYDRALPLHKRALAIAETSLGPGHPTTGIRLNNLALRFKSMGLYHQALPLHQRALAIAETSLGPDHPDTGSRLSNLAGLYLAMGEHDQALPLFQRALAINEQSLGPHHPETSTSLNNLALMFESLGQHHQALPLQQRALAIAEQSQGSDHPSTATSLNNLAKLHQAMGQVDQALPLFQRALAIAGQSGMPELAWTVQGNLMRLYARRRDQAPALHQPDLAIWYGKQAVNALQAVRGRLQGLDHQDAQGSFLKQNRHTYETLANLLIDAGRITEAEQVLAMLKEREVAELTRSTATDPPRSQADFAGVERRALAEQQRLSAAGVKDATELAALEKRIDAGETLESADAARHQALLKAAEAWRADYQRFVASLGQLFAEAARRLVADQADLQTTRLQARVALDGAGAVGLHYVVSDERIGIIVATPGGSFGRFSAVPRAELNRQITALRQAIVARADTRPSAHALWKMLIAPVLADIQASGARTLVLSLTDTLRYLPFAALQDAAGRYLVQDHALALWAAAADATPTASTTAWRVTGLGLTQARPGFSALPAVRQELQAIVRTEGGQGLLPGQIALDEQFSRERLQTALSGQNNVLHVASHFDFRPGDESRSVLLLGQGEPISLGQLAVMNFRRVEQLTLSACDTATGGGVNDNGAEVEGLAAVVLRQQAKSVLATLWKVADASTAELMRAFYAQRAGGGNPPSRAQALRQAQLALLTGRAEGQPDVERGAQTVATTGQPTRTQPVDPARPWAHPFYWAPFVLSGSWL